MDELSLTFLSSSVHSNAKFSLYLKIHEMQELTKILERVLTFSESERALWIAEHGGVLNTAIDTLVQDSNKTIAQLSLDDETLELSKELVLKLRDTIEMMQGILFEPTSLQS